MARVKRLAAGEGTTGEGIGRRRGGGSWPQEKKAGRLGVSGTHTTPRDVASHDRTIRRAAATQPS